MKFNTKVRYGVRAMVEIGLNESPNGIFQKDISSNQEISNRYLDHIIASLKVAGLITTQKGKKSGYILTRKSDEISLYDIYRAFESDINIVDCLGVKQTCNRMSKCATHETWLELNTIISDFLKTQFLSDIIQKQKMLNQ